MDAKALQSKLVSLKYNPGPVDGDLGPQTFTALLNYTAGRDLGSLSILTGRALAGKFPQYQIVSELRIAHFLAQAAHETFGFRRFVEMGSGDGPDADPWDDYLEQYDFRKTLGNYQGGDGEKYRGRGIFQITGRYNYQKYGDRLGIPLINMPQRAAEPEIAVATACMFWADHALNVAADRDDVTYITHAINGGYNGLDDRKAYLARLKKVLV